MAGRCCPVRLINFGWLLTLGVILLTPVAVESQSPTMETLLANLTDGAYQLCTEPAPEDWRDGSGTCLNIDKQGTIVDGYYGYPHSSAFVCLRGSVIDDWFHGKGLLISWIGNPWSEMSQEGFIWDAPEGLLSLSQAELVHSEGVGEEQVRWIIFHTVKLNMQSMYLYDSPRMTSPVQLCDWPVN
ncbi:hypothetical protein Lepto7375DRAFT_0376 [Leptolyngbya sp. PCC 7375]|nr:hypothetical protein Lepto7375DRAFT_0376 [Leptolyngbya sp. PCC 7375]